MSILETIKKRRSVRTFSETVLSSEDIQKIIDFAERVKNPYKIPITWKILDASKDGLSSPVIVGANTYIAGKMSRVPHAEEAFGYAFEKIVLFAEDLGVGTTWIAGTMNRAAFEKAMEVTKDEILPCVSPLGYPAKKMSLRESMMRKGVKADSRFEFSKICFDGSFEKPLTKDAAGMLANILEAVRLAPSAVNKQPWRIVLCGDKVHFYEKQSRGYIDGSWDIQKIDMGIALSHFELVAVECGINPNFVIEDPKIQSNQDVHYIASFLLK